MFIQVFCELRRLRTIQYNTIPPEQITTSLRFTFSSNSARTLAIGSADRPACCDIHCGCFCCASKAVCSVAPVADVERKGQAEGGGAGIIEETARYDGGYRAPSPSRHFRGVLISPPQDRCGALPCTKSTKSLLKDSPWFGFFLAASVAAAASAGAAFDCDKASHPRRRQSTTTLFKRSRSACTFGSAALLIFFFAITDSAAV